MLWIYQFLSKVLQCSVFMVLDNNPRYNDYDPPGWGIVAPPGWSLHQERPIFILHIIFKAERLSLDMCPSSPPGYYVVGLNIICTLITTPCKYIPQPKVNYMVHLYSKYILLFYTHTSKECRSFACRASCCFAVLCDS